MAYEHILYEVDGGVLTITLNRPEKLNAFTPTMMRELIDAFDRADSDDDVLRGIRHAAQFPQRLCGNRPPASG